MPRACGLYRLAVTFASHHYCVIHTNMTFSLGFSNFSNTAAALVYMYIWAVRSLTLFGNFDDAERELIVVRTECTCTRCSFCCVAVIHALLHAHVYVTYTCLCPFDSAQLAMMHPLRPHVYVPIHVCIIFSLVCGLVSLETHRFFNWFVATLMISKLYECVQK